MNSSRCFCALILLSAPVLLTACAHPPKSLGRTSSTPPPLPAVLLAGRAKPHDRQSSAPATTVASRGKAEAIPDVDSSTAPDLQFQFAEHSASPEPAEFSERPKELSIAQRNGSTPRPDRFESDSAAPRPSTDKGKTHSKSVLTLKQLEEIAEESNPALVQLAAVVDKARGVHEQVGLYPNPVVGYSGSEIGSDGSAGQQGGFISQTIVTGDKLALNRNVAGWNIQELSWAYQVRRHRVLNDVRLRYYEVLGAQQRLSVAGELLKVAENGVKLVKQLEKAKQAPRADVLQATIDLNEIQIIGQNAQYEYDAAWKRLLAVLGRPTMPGTELTGSLGGQSANWNWEETYGKLVSESPQLQSLYARVEGARAAIKRQEAQPIPNLLTQFGMSHDFSSGDVLTSVQVGVPLPIYNRNQGNIRLAHAELQRAIRDAERLELQLRDRLAVAFRDLQQAAFQVSLYEKSILKNADESRKLTEESYQIGVVNFLRVLTARRTYFETNLRYINSLIALRKAEVVTCGYVLTGGLTDVPDIASRALKGPGIRGQALSGQ